MIQIVTKLNGLFADCDLDKTQKDLCALEIKNMRQRIMDVPHENFNANMRVLPLASDSHIGAHLDDATR